MTVNVLVVDDSAFFRRRIKEILEKNSQIKVIGFADNGKDAVEKAVSLDPDVITMDYEMPQMNGIVAVREIMGKHPTPILMFSSLTYEGARVTLDALDAGAVDYLPKSFEAMSSDPGASATKRCFHWSNEIVRDRQALRLQKRPLQLRHVQRLRLPRLLPQRGRYLLQSLHRLRSLKI